MPGKGYFERLVLPFLLRLDGGEILPMDGIGRPLGSKTCDYIADYTPPYWVGVVTNMDNRSPILSAHPGGAHILFADGSVHFLTEDIPFELFQLLAIRDSGEVKSCQDY